MLVVDDEHMVRIMVQLGLERNGFDVWLARNGREAIDLYRRHMERDCRGAARCPTCPVWTDLRHWRSCGELNPEVLACFMSGDTGTYEPEELLHRGAANVITKPFRLDDLANILRLMAHGVSADFLPSGRVCQG